MPQSSAPTPVDRKLYGDLADDVHLLRSRGHEVARFKGDFRVDREVLTADELRGRANKERDRRSTKSCGGVESRHAKAGNMPGSVPGEDVSASPSRLAGATEVGSISKSRAGVAPGPQDRLCACGKPANHKGMCPVRWLKRKANNGPSGIRNGDRAPVSSVPTPSLTPTRRQHRKVDPTTLCGCGRPGNHYGQCWVRRGLSGPPVRQRDSGATGARLDALEARVAELERRLA